jgi:intein/homing endonuclease
VKTELNLNPRLFVRSNGLRFRINSKSFVDWLKEEGIPAGDKKAHTTIPKFITGDPRLLVGCIRGIFDTDGSVYFDRRPIYRRPYPRIDLHMSNGDLLAQLSVLLARLGVRHSFAKNRGSIQTAGVGALKQFLLRVGFSNFRHISRIGKDYPELIEFNSRPHQFERWKRGRS